MKTILFILWILGALGCLYWLLTQDEESLSEDERTPFVLKCVFAALWFISWPLMAWNKWTQHDKGDEP